MTIAPGNWVKSDVETELRRILRGVGLAGEHDLDAKSPACALARSNVEGGLASSSQFDARLLPFFAPSVLRCAERAVPGGWAARRFAFTARRKRGGMPSWSALTGCNSDLTRPAVCWVERHVLNVLLGCEQ